MLAILYSLVTCSTLQNRISAELFSKASSLTLSPVFFESMTLTFTDRNDLMLLALQPHRLQHVVDDFDWGRGDVALAVVARPGRDVLTFLGSCNWS